MITTTLLAQLLDGVKLVKECKISGGKLPKDKEFTINLTCDFTGVTVGKALQSFAMPDRVVAFQRARDTMTVEQLEKMERTGHTVMAQDAGKAYRDPMEEMTKLWPTMSAVQRDSFLKSIGVGTEGLEAPKVEAPKNPDVKLRKNNK